MADKPIPPPPPIMESRIFGPNDPVVFVRKRPGKYTVKRTGKPQNHSAASRQERINYRELMKAPNGR
jgi:hypothetical protein